MPASVVRDETLVSELDSAFRGLLKYCEANDWAGYDPYDALNSRLFEKVSFLHRRIPQIVLTQLLKRSPINLRPMLGVPRTQNPKALALFLSALTKAAAAGIADYGCEVTYLAERLERLRSPEPRYWCWGYSFAWQTRTIIVPPGAPNLICTTFVADALLDLYEYCGNLEYLKMATSSAEYILDQLYWQKGDSLAGFAYPLPTVRNQVHNANLVAAALLCRVARHTGEQKFLRPALTAARFSASRQNADGSWRYGEAPTQQFVDNFHTGFNLCALRSMTHHLRSDEFEEYVSRGFRYYRDRFFLKDGSVRYFHNRTYPIDIHAVAQSIITPAVLSDISVSNVELSASVFRWAMKHMWDAGGYFYYRVLRSGTVRIPYMRWSEAWMALAMAQLLWTLRQRGSNAPIAAAAGSLSKQAKP